MKHTRDDICKETSKPEPRMILGVPVAPCTMEMALDRVEAAIDARRPLLVGVVNAAKVVNMRRDPDLRAAVLSSELILADGMGVVWASRILGKPLPERVTGIDLMLGMLRRGRERGWRVYCLGATDEVVREAVARMRREFPGVDFVGWRNGYFTRDEEPAIVEAIAAKRPDILLVAMTSPRKERFLSRWNERLGVPVCHGVGGSFDVVAGKVDRAPALWQRLGLEWLYRVKQEPGRLWRRYAETNLLFAGAVLKDLVKKAFGAA